MENEKSVFDTAVEYALENAKSAYRDVNQYLAASVALSGIAELADVSSVGVSSLYGYYGTNDTYGITGCELTFYLKESAKNSKLVHKLAQRFGCKFEKTPGWDGKSLVAKAKTDDGKWAFEIRGYVPSTCALVTEEVELTAEEIEQARANVPTVRKVTKVVCA